MQTTLMIIIVAACTASAAHWFASGAWAAGFAFGGFALGYIGLAILFR